MAMITKPVPGQNREPRAVSWLSPWVSGVQVFNPSPVTLRCSSRKLGQIQSSQDSCTGCWCPTHWFHPLQPNTSPRQFLLVSSLERCKDFSWRMEKGHLSMKGQWKSLVCSGENESLTMTSEQGIKISVWVIVWSLLEKDTLQGLSTHCSETELQVVIVRMPGMLVLTYSRQLCCCSSLGFLGMQIARSGPEESPK